MCNKMWAGELISVKASLLGDTPTGGGPRPGAAKPPAAHQTPAAHQKHGVYKESIYLLP